MYSERILAMGWRMVVNLIQVISRFNVEPASKVYLDLLQEDFELSQRKVSGYQTLESSIQNETFER